MFKEMNRRKETNKPIKKTRKPKEPFSKCCKKWQGQKQTKKDIGAVQNGRRDKKRHQRRPTDENRRKQTETDRNGQKQS